MLIIMKWAGICIFCLQMVLDNAAFIAINYTPFYRGQFTYESILKIWLALQSNYLLDGHNLLFVLACDM